MSGQISVRFALWLLLQCSSSALLHASFAASVDFKIREQTVEQIGLQNLHVCI